MSVESLELRLTELTAQFRELSTQSEAVERERNSLRTDAVLGRLDDASEQRVELLAEQAKSITGALREVSRLKRLSHAELTKARAKEATAAEVRAKEIALLARDKASLELPGARAELQEAAGRYIALWGLANMEKPYFTAKPERAITAINQKELAAFVAEFDEQYKADIEL